MGVKKRADQAAVVSFFCSRKEMVCCLSDARELIGKVRDGSTNQSKHLSTEKKR